MLLFLIGLMVGGMFGIFIMCLMTAASRADEQRKRIWKRKNGRKNR